MTGVSCELLVRVAGAERRDGGVEDGGVAEAGVEIAGGEGARRAAEGADRVSDFASAEAACAVLGPHLARRVDLRPGDVRVHVDAAGHDDESGEIERATRRFIRF